MTGKVNGDDGRGVIPTLYLVGIAFREVVGAGELNCSQRPDITHGHFGGDLDLRHTLSLD